MKKTGFSFFGILSVVEKKKNRLLFLDIMNSLLWPQIWNISKEENLHIVFYNDARIQMKENEFPNSKKLRVFFSNCAGIEAIDSCVFRMQRTVTVKRENIFNIYADQISITSPLVHSVFMSLSFPQTINHSDSQVDII